MNENRNPKPWEIYVRTAAVPITYRSADAVALSVGACTLITVAFFTGEPEVLQEHVPSLSLNEARCLTYHARGWSEMAERGFHFNYGAETWGANVPDVVRSATFKLRFEILTQWRPDLSEDQATRIVSANMEAEIKQGEFWSHPLLPPGLNDINTALDVLGDD